MMETIRLIGMGLAFQLVYAGAVSADTGRENADTSAVSSDDTVGIAPAPIRPQEKSTDVEAHASSPDGRAVSTGKPLSEKERSALDERIKKVVRLRFEISLLKKRAEKSTALLARVLANREDKVRAEALTEALEVAEEVAKKRDAGFDVTAYEETAREWVRALPDAVYASLQRVDRPESALGISDEELSAAQQAARDAKMNESTEQADGMLRILIDGLSVQEQFGVDATEEKAKLKAALTDAAQIRSALLELTLDDIPLLSSQAAQLSDDKEIQAKLRVLGTRGEIVTAALERTVGMMKSLGLDSSRYDAQLMEASGKITADIFDSSVVKGVFEKWMDSAASWFDENGLSMAFQTVLFLFIIFVFWVISRVAQRLVRRLLEHSNLNFSKLLKRMIVSLTKNLILLTGFVVALSQLGISLGPLLAGVGVAGFIVGFALQDTLSNFASGMMILLYRPFDVGDILEAGGVFGRVNKMSLVNTTVLTFDNQTLIVPNNKIWGDTIKNVTAQSIRRVDMVFGVSYSEDIPKIEAVLREIVTSCEKVLAEPEPMIHLHELGDSSVNFVVRPWAETDDYWDVYWEVHRKVKMTFDAEGISIPFPQRDVHFFNESPGAGGVDR